jgi:hypothetical protein
MRILSPSNLARCRSTANIFYVKLVLSMVPTKINVFGMWNVTPFSLVESYQHFRGTCCLHFHGITPLPQTGGSRFFQKLTIYQTVWRRISDNSNLQEFLMLEHTNLKLLPKTNSDYRWFLVSSWTLEYWIKRSVLYHGTEFTHLK